MPHLLLRLEGAVVLAAAVLFYFRTGGGGLLFALLLLAPDVSMLGYLGGQRLGSACYNLVHTYALPLALLSAALVAGWDVPAHVALVWTAHIGMDRLLGYGLKYATGFKDTHLQRVT